MILASASLTSVTTSGAIPLDYKRQWSATVYVTNGTATFSVEGTLDNIQDSTVTPVWFALTNMSGITASSLLQKIDYPLKAIRLNVTAYTSGTTLLKVLQ